MNLYRSAMEQFSKK